MNNTKIIIRALLLNIVFTFNCFSTTAVVDPLSSWHEGKSKQSIIQFVNEVTKKDSTNFVAKKERIATFDNDGTLWAEQPIYAQLIFVIERIHGLAPQYPEWQTKQPFVKLLNGDVEGAFSHDENAANDIVMAATTGMTDAAYTDIVKRWSSTAKHPISQRLFTEMVYQPMLELITYLQANDFKTYIVSGGGRQFIRAWSETVYGIPPEQVIGSTVKRSYLLQEGKYAIVRLPEMDFYNNNSDKVIAINTHIGRRPIAAFGNSDGDMQMLNYVTDGDGPRLGMLIHHTDEKREWAYDRKSKIGHLDKALDNAKANRWVIVDMKVDWKTIYKTIN